MSFISMAHATEAAGTAAASAPSAGDAFIMNMGLILVMLLFFYIIMIRPQQRRMKEQRSMLDALQKGDKVLTSGGLIATVSKVLDEQEIELDLGGVKVTAMRYSIQGKIDLEDQKSNDNKDKKDEKK